MANPEKGLKQPPSSPGEEEPTALAELHVLKLEVDGEPSDDDDDDGEMTTGSRLILAGTLEPSHRQAAGLACLNTPCGTLAEPQEPCEKPPDASGPARECNSWPRRARWHRSAA